MGEIWPQNDPTLPTCHPHGFSPLLRGSQSSSPSSPISTLLMGEVPHILTRCETYEPREPSEPSVLSVPISPYHIIILRCWLYCQASIISQPRLIVECNTRAAEASSALPAISECKRSFFYPFGGDKPMTSHIPGGDWVICDLYIYIFYG